MEKKYMLDKINKVFFMIYIASLLFVPDYVVSLISDSKNPPYSDVILLVVIILFLIQLAINSKKRKKILNLFTNKWVRYINVTFILILLIMTISIIYAVEKRLAIQETIRFATIYFIAIFSMVEYREVEISKKILNFILIGSTFSGILGIYQYITGLLIDRKYVYSYSFGADVRVTSIFSNPNTYAAFLIIIIFPLLMVCIYEKVALKKIIYSAIFLLLVVNLVFTYSRSSWLGLFLGLVILAILWNKKILWVLGTGILAVAVTPPIRSRFLDLFDKTVNEGRIKIWKTYGHMIKENLFCGVGNGNSVSKYDFYVNKYPELNFEGVSRFPTHNSYIKVFSELGIFGIIFFITLFILSLFLVYKFVSKTKENFMKAFYLGVIASMGSIAFMNLYDNLFFVPKMIMILWIFIFIGIGNYLRINKS